MNNDMSFQGLVSDVIQRIDDVKKMCEKRCENLRRFTDRPARPVQPVAPKQMAPPGGSASRHNVERKRKRLNRKDSSAEKVSGWIK